MIRAALLFALVPGFAVGQTGFQDAGIPWGTLRSGQTARSEKPLTIVLDSEGDLQRYWREHNGQGQPPTGVDFTANQVVAIHLGTRRGQAKVYVKKVERFQSRTIMVSYVEETSGGLGRDDRGTPEGRTERKIGGTTIITNNGGGGGSTSSPWTLVRIKRVGGDIRFSASQEQYRGTTLGDLWNDPNTVRVPPGGGVIIDGSGWDGGYWSNPSPWYQQNCPQVRTLTSGTYSKATTAGIYTLDNAQQLSDYWQTAFDGTTSAPKTIDWNRFYVVAAHLGTRSTGGFSLSLGKVGWIKEGSVGVKLIESRPNPREMTMSVITSPFTLLLVQRGNHRVMFGSEVQINR